MVIHHERIFLYEFSKIYLSNSVLSRKSFLIICFPHAIEMKKTRPLARALAGPTGSPHDMEYFLLFFRKRVSTAEQKKMKLGNKERLTAYLP